MTKKIVVNITDEAYEALNTTPEIEGITRTDMISRALKVYAALSAAKRGQKITLRNTDHGGDVWVKVRILEERAS